MRDQLISLFQMPQKTIFNRKIAKKHFHEQGQLTTAEKELLTTEIESIYLLSICKQDTLKTPKYVNENRRYEEIYWLFISFKSIKRYERMIKLFHKVMPNPIVILASDEYENISISTAHKRLNHNDETKTVVEDAICSPRIKLSNVDEAAQRFLQRICFNNLLYSNLYTFYESIDSAVRMSALIEKISSYPKMNASSEELIPLINSLDDADKNINQLQQLQKEQLGFGEKMELHIKIKKQEQEKDQLLNRIKELC
ncbi:DUF4391 domain-containing protein [Aquibacillus kalidii]|uniref:DUF4391 domain-containing protein n=1 Tax=Aquibacillus kalidii TaxID=2762597 RepID=UPI001645EA45|nr:DUF4391 domain-containing protein [Aquibacillus kalidii]